MTALSFNLTPSKSIDVTGLPAGLPLEGLPPFEAGRTLPEAFAELLGKASKSAEKPAVEAEKGDTPAIAEGEVAGDADGPAPDVDAGLQPSPKLAPPTLPLPSDKVTTPAKPHPTCEPETANGKSLPPGRPEIADATTVPAEKAAPVAPGPEASLQQPGTAGLPVVQDDIGRAPKPKSAGEDAPTKSANPATTAPGAPPAHPDMGQPVAGRAERTAPELAPAVEDFGGAKPKDARATDPKTDPVERAEKESGDRAPVTVPVDQLDAIALIVDTPDAPPPPPAPAPAPAPADKTMVIAAANVAVAQQGAVAPAAAATPASANGGPATTPRASTAFAKVDGTKLDAPAPQAPQPFLGAQSAPRGEGQTVQADATRSGRQADQVPVNASAAPSPKGAPELPQTGLSLQLRAADKPMAADRPVVATEANQPTLQSNGGGSLGQSIAAPLSQASIAAPAPGVASQTAPLPHFPELAALVDRIAAARSSAGSATATIAVAHKELGNLSLTFETTGHTLDVEVAAQDSDTQRSIAAAIAADRPHIRVADAQPQTQAPAQSLHSQLASSAHGGGADARHSGTAGDAQPDRRGDGRSGNRQSGGTNAQGRPDPKSDGGIYA